MRCFWSWTDMRINPNPIMRVFFVPKKRRDRILPRLFNLPQKAYQPGKLFFPPGRPLCLQGGTAAFGGWIRHPAHLWRELSSPLCKMGLPFKLPGQRYLFRKSHLYGTALFLLLSVSVSCAEIRSRRFILLCLSQDHVPGQPLFCGRLRNAGKYPFPLRH